MTAPKSKKTACAAEGGWTPHSLLEHAAIHILFNCKDTDHNKNGSRV